MARILLTEDKEDVAYVIKEMLHHEGHEVSVANNASTAIKLLMHNEYFDLIITDVIMPVMDGYDLIGYLKEQSLDIPVIVMSGGGNSLSAESALVSLEAEVQGIIQKPMEMEHLVRTVNGVLK